LRKFIAHAMVLMTILSLLSMSSLAQSSEIPVYLNGEKLILADPPLIKEGSTLAPMRGLFEALGAEVLWEQASQTAIGKRDGIIVRIPIGSTSPTIDGVTKTIPVAAEIINGRTYIPLRFVGEAFGDIVNWVSNTRSVEINRKVIEPPVKIYQPYSTVNAENIHYVPSDFATIQQAIFAARNGDAIVVDEGMYEENIDFLGKDIILTSNKGPEKTVIHGGYEGIVIRLHSGENENTILHGFTITKGTAGLSKDGDDSLIYPRGGGVSILNSSPIISGCIITKNAATDFGGGISITGSESSPIIENNVITENISHYQGAGISINDGASPTIRGNTISRNFAEAASGIVAAGNSSAVIENNVIIDNIAGYDTTPDIIFDYLHKNPDFYNWVKEWGQHPAFPSGILASQHSNLNIKDNEIIGNDGGGVGALHGSQLILENNIIRNNGNLNLGAITGGVMAAYDSKLILTANSINNNIGPAVWIDNRDSNIYSNLTSVINLPNGSSSTPIRNNSVSGIIVSWPYERPEVSMASNPRTILVPSDFTSIQEAINHANNGDTIEIAPGVYNQSIDFKGKHITVRSQDPTDENIVRNTILQGGDPNAPDGGQGPIAVFINGEGNEARIEGLTLKNRNENYFNMSAVYIESASPTIRNNLITSKNGTAVLMNWAYTNLYINENREEAGRFTSVEGYETAPIFENNTVYDNKVGGGMWYYYASPIIKNNIFINNNGPLSGAIHNWFSNAVIENNQFIYNSGEVGGALHFENFAIVDVSGNIFEGNYANGGAAIHIDSPTYGLVESNVFTNNRVDLNSIGSAASIGMLAEVTFTNNLINENYGWSIYAGGAKATLINNTLANNWKDDSRTDSQGVFAMGHGVIDGYNNIFYHSALDEYRDDGKGFITIKNSLFYDTEQRFWTGDGNFSANPRFIGPTDFRLSSNSPARNKGIDVDFSTDILGNSRPKGSGVDLGAYEYQE